jgi:hypothetical protein
LQVVFVLCNKAVGIIYKQIIIGLKTDESW